MSAVLLNSNVESAILSRIVDPGRGHWPPEASRAILSLALPAEDREKMDSLAEKAAAGSLTTDEEVEIEGYRHVCRLLDLLKARARVALSHPTTPGS